MTWPTRTCKCGADIIMATESIGGDWLPVDAYPAEKGTVRLESGYGIRGPVAIKLTGQSWFAGLHTPHNCSAQKGCQ